MAASEMPTRAPLRPVREAQPWRADSWQAFPAAQMPHYENPAELRAALDQLERLPPLVTSWEVLALKQYLAEAQQGKRFLLQGGDCAETFADCTNEVIANRLKVLLQMSLVLVHGLRKPVLRVGRFAGQYAKPRSADTETIDGVTLPVYRGDLVNGPEFTPATRRPDPKRMLEGHARSGMTMNFVRALIDGGFADLHHPEYWNLAWVERSPLAAEYRHMVAGISSAMHFMETLAGPIGGFQRADFYTSHEALLLPYEQSMTRQVPRQWGWFDLSTHFPWIGMRTAALDGAHVEFCRGIRNPVAIKVGPAMHADQLQRLIDAVMAAGRRVLWVCDPMHGNTEKLGNGVKTRRFANIRSELEQAFDIHAAAGSRLGGVHLELTGEDVTECMGGARNLSEADLGRAYKSTVDPRLNYEQSLELAMLVVRKSGHAE